MAGRDADEIASQAWGWLSDAESTYRKSEDGSVEELQAIQAMSLAALTAMFAEREAKRR